jgi:hypothetical protein
VKIVWAVGDFVGFGDEYLFLHKFQVKIVIWTSWVICCNYLVIESLVKTLNFWRHECWIFVKQTDGTIW